MIVSMPHGQGRMVRSTELACLITSSPMPLLAECCSLDTGRLNGETYRLFEAVEKHYGIRIEYTFPDAKETMDLVRAKGQFSFYTDGHTECCKIRKVGQLFVCWPVGSKLMHAAICVWSAPRTTAWQAIAGMTRACPVPCI